MIKSKELRIGNWVTNGEKNHTADANVIYDVAMSEFNDGEFPIEPIPLTPEILEKCGTVEGRCFYTNDKQLIIWRDLVYSKYWFDCNNQKIEIKSLHQLQNIYFALTGEELTVNL